MKRTCSQIVLVLSLSCGAAIAAPYPNEFAHGITVHPDDIHPLIEIAVPDDVYQHVTRADLADVRVFNANDSVVPHALCPAPTSTNPIVESVVLPVFELQATRAEGEGARIDVNAPGGVAVRIESDKKDGGVPASSQTQAHVIDAREANGALRSIQFEWQSPDNASEAHVRIEASDDLDRWRTIVAASTLVRLERDGQHLRRQRIPLPEQRYSYLRVARTDRGPALRISGVIAERVADPVAIDPLWVAPKLLPPEDNALVFDAERRAPITHARLRLLTQNTSVRVEISSRDDPKQPWVRRWSGEVYSIEANGAQRQSPPAQFASTSDRYWRIAYVAPSTPLKPPPSLELGYHPARLRFLAQGDGPFTLAFGSRRAEPAPAPAQHCNSLLSDVPVADLEGYMATGTTGSMRVLGGATALEPKPKKTPAKQIILWAVLAGGTALLVAMALSLLKRVRVDQTAD